MEPAPGPTVLMLCCVTIESLRHDVRPSRTSDLISLAPHPRQLAVTRSSHCEAVGWCGLNMRAQVFFQLDERASDLAARRVRFSACSPSNARACAKLATASRVSSRTDDAAELWTVAWAGRCRRLTGRPDRRSLASRFTWKYSRELLGVVRKIFQLKGLSKTVCSDRKSISNNHVRPALIWPG